MDKPSQTTRWFLLAAAIAAAVYAATKGFTPVQFTANDPATIGNQLLTLIFIALVIERAVEVFVNNLYGADELVVRRPLRVQQADVDMLDEAVIKRAAMPVVQSQGVTEAVVITDMNQVKEELDKARAKLLTTRSAVQPALEGIYIRKRAAAASFAVAIGLLVAIAGTRIFADLVLNGAESLPDLIKNTNQLIVFNIADILITALLLAGGADGIHQVLKRFVLIEKDIKA